MEDKRETMRKANFVSLGLQKNLPFDDLFEPMLIEEEKYPGKAKKQGK